MSETPEQETRRAALQETINSAALEREALEAKFGVGNVWDTEELQRDFEVRSFLAPFTSVTRKSDGKEGVLAFQHWPRYYFGWTEANE